MIIYQISRAKFVSSRISQNIFFHMIGKKSFYISFFERGGGVGGGFQNWSLPNNVFALFRGRN